MSHTHTHATPRLYDLVVFGATGFTGRRVARHLASAAPPTVRWAIAGRNRDKLLALKAELVACAPRCENVGLMVADIADQASLRLLAQDTRVVLNTAGPFNVHGEPVVRACVEAGTDYLDLTGEAAFVERIERSLAKQARRNGVRLIPCCGFEAAIADLGVWFTLKHLPIDGPVAVRGYVTVNGQLSGGSLQTALLAMGDLRHARLPLPRLDAPRTVRQLRPTLGWHSALHGWVLPMAMIDQDIVLRSAACLPAYGEDFAYAHHIVFERFGAMLGIVGRLLLMVVGAQSPLTRRWLQQRLRQSGEGPGAQDIERGWFRMRVEASSGRNTVSAVVSGGDPGYGETAKILAQAGLCLVEDQDLPRLAGLLTPAQAMGDALIARLQNVGIGFHCIQEEHCANTMSGAA